MAKDKKNIKSLHVQEGISQPSSINNESVNRFKQVKKKALTADEYVSAIIAGDRTVLSKAITLIESSLPEHQDLARDIISACLKYSGKSLRIGITGVPGVGKSTFIEAIGKYVTSIGKKLAVLAVDPSSDISKGSILGDKTRMEELSIDSHAYIRPSPSGGNLGGVARKTRESVILCEAAGYDVIFIETVGVGQSETSVHSMVDFFLLLMLAGAGDELQGIKRGIMEMADMIVINKADGDNLQKANSAKVQYENALHLFPSKESGWIPKVQTCSAINKVDIDKVWEVITEFFKLTEQNDHYRKNRLNQSLYWMRQTINEELTNNFYSSEIIQTKIAELEHSVITNQLSSIEAAKKLISLYFKK